LRLAGRSSRGKGLRLGAAARTSAAGSRDETVAERALAGTGVMTRELGTVPQPEAERAESAMGDNRESARRRGEQGVNWVELSQGASVNAKSYADHGKRAVEQRKPESRLEGG
jgi:predicted alternative tryptophan synthase beta-subunit